MKHPKPLPDLPLSTVALPSRQGTDLFSSKHNDTLAVSLPKVIGDILDQESWSFSCGDAPGDEEIVLAKDEIVSPDGMLPLIIREAEKMMALAFGSSPSIRWAEVPGALCILQPDQIQEKSATLAVWSLFCHYAMETLQGAHPSSALEGEPASMTKWRQAFLADIDRGELRPVAPTAPPRPGSRPAGER